MPQVSAASAAVPQLRYKVGSGHMALFGRSYGPSKVCKLALENGLCSHVPGIIGQKFLQHLFSRAFLVKISLLLEQSVSPVGRQTPF